MQRGHIDSIAVSLFNAILGQITNTSEAAVVVTKRFALYSKVSVKRWRFQQRLQLLLQD